ncbi:carbon monoxide dehydrogenase [Streptomyces agglomeratus]|uniref:Carbon monoxide dehydrogenase n=1 Tax=Streptomyces agglomeratus TaxID=285458 RepID=A0A1E5P8H8_9ACTN|nr:SRPBCC domain-containing protein [Streptomyces agglomeratus]OEJ25861.1 carbon monoxide dehydrogenase [Streptomyces agglomeratus]OEJ52643.1 carbon monoxide dehydrogenase [Streptomyces agglomeratus]
MEHEVFVPVPVEALREAFGDPARVARCVPGLQQDADEASGPLAGRLKVRIDGHTITYRGTLRLTGRPDGSFGVEGEGTEARGTGSAELALTVRLTETDGGTTVTYAGTAGGEGRIAELDAAATLAACGRLLDRFTTRLAEEAEGGASGTAAESGAVDESGAVGEVGEARSSVFETEVPPPSLDPSADVPDVPDLPEVPDAPDAPELADVSGLPAPAELPAEPPAEAAHARRTMIGRSAEEVDHAPPRGRYAPVPAPQSTSTTDTLRWIAPAAALALASAVVVSRVLRRRR